MHSQTSTNDALSCSFLVGTSITMRKIAKKTIVDRVSDVHVLDYNAKIT